jgi:hypothetical protein
MKKHSTKSDREPSAASLREIPEIDLAGYRPVGRGRHTQKARGSFETLVLDKKLVDALGGVERIAEILHAIASAMMKRKPRRRRAA